MLLAIDIGNTNISFGIFSATNRGGFAENYGERKERVARRFDILTKDYNFQKLKKRLSGAVNINDSIVCSVVPKATEALEKDLKRLSGKPPYIIGKNIEVPIKNLYRRPGEVGQDRLVNAYAGVALYGFPLIVVDFGTAVTFDVISKNKEYSGGMILPGLRISLSVLAQETALLPKIHLQSPKEFIGSSTKESMLSGIVYGFAALTDDLTKRIKGKIGTKALVIGTGGDINLIGRYCRMLDKIDKDLTLKGLNLIYKKQGFSI